MDQSKDWFIIKNLEQVDTPALVVYKDRLISNIDQLISETGTEVLRPHVKTNKSSDVCRILIGRGINKFKCATIAEAEMLGRAGATDVLLAYQPTKQKLSQLIRLIKEFSQTTYSYLVDNVESAKLFDIEAGKNALTLNVFIDLNVGMDRTGIEPQLAPELFEVISKLPNLMFCGLHAYDGHNNEIDPFDREKLCESDFVDVETLRDIIEKKTGKLPLLIAGGSPTYKYHAKRKNTECSPGTFVFWDVQYKTGLPDLNFSYAVLVLSRIVSLPAKDKICIDLGYKAVSSEHQISERTLILNSPELKPLSHSEEHLVLPAPENHQYKIGDVMYCIPFHVCPTVALYNKCLVVAEGLVIGEWNIDARERL